jgi:hypothetical protein
MTAPLLSMVSEWYCPNCGLTTRVDRVVRNRFHVCPKLRMMTAPMVLAGTSAKVELVERGDYVGREMVRLDPERGRPVQSIVTTRDNGQDCVVFAPTATAKGD